MSGFVSALGSGAGDTSWPSEDGIECVCVCLDSLCPWPSMCHFQRQEGSDPERGHPSFQQQHTHSHTHTHTHTHLHTLTHTLTHTHTHTYTHSHTLTLSHTHTHTHSLRTHTHRITPYRRLFATTSYLVASIFRGLIESLDAFINKMALTVYKNILVVL